MREILTEFDELQEALKKIDMNEDAMPIYNSKVLIGENAESYKKMQLILGSPEMHSAHKFIYNLDPEQLSEDEIDQVNKIFTLGVNRGFIQPPQEEQSAPVAPAIPYEDGTPAPDAKVDAVKPANTVKIPCWTILYSATKGGDIKTGECYSNSIDARAAKADCLAKLSRCGYENISILALEQGDPDSCGFNKAECKCETEKVEEDDILKNRAHNNHIAEGEDEVCPECGKSPCICKEDDMLDNRPHNNHIAEGETAPLGAYEMKLTLTDIDPETFLPGHVDNWIEEMSNKNRNVKFEKLDQTEDGVEVKITGEYDALEKIYADYLKYDSIYDLRNSRFDYDEFKDAIAKIEESEEEIKESGNNPYAAGMKTSDVGGMSSIGASKSQKKAAIKEEDDEKSDSDSEDDAEDSSEEDDSGEESKDDSKDEEKEEEDSEADDSSDDSESSDDSSNDDSSDDNDKSDDDEDGSSDETDGNDDSESSLDSDSSSNDDSEEDEDSDKEDSDEEDNSSDEEDEDSDSEDDTESNDSESDEDDNESDELSDEEKAELKNDYKKTFKDILLKCKFEDKCFDDLTIDQKVKFFTKLAEKWTKNEPKEFMSDKEIEQLNKVVVKK